MKAQIHKNNYIIIYYINSLIVTTVILAQLSFCGHLMKRMRGWLNVCYMHTSGSFSAVEVPAEHYWSLSLPLGVGAHLPPLHTCGNGYMCIDYQWLCVPHPCNLFHDGRAVYTLIAIFRRVHVRFLIN